MASSWIRTIPRSPSIGYSTGVGFRRSRRQEMLPPAHAAPLEPLRCGNLSALAWQDRARHVHRWNSIFIRPRYLSSTCTVLVVGLVQAIVTDSLTHAACTEDKKHNPCAKLQPPSNATVGAVHANILVSSGLAWPASSMLLFTTQSTTSCRTSLPLTRTAHGVSN